MKQAINRKKRYYRFHTRTLFLIDAMFNLFFLAFLLPFASHTLELIMDLSNISYITQENILSLLTSPHAVILLTVLVAVVLLFLLTKLSSLIYYCNTEAVLQRPFLLHLVYFGLFKTLHSIKEGRLTLLFFVLPFYIFTNLPVLLGITFLADIEFTSGTHDEAFIKGLILLGLILISFISFRILFAFHYYLNEHLTFTKALQYSKELLTGRGRRTLQIFLINNLVFTLGFFLFYYALLYITAIGAYFFADKNLSITVFLSAYPKISLYATLFFSMITFVFNINLTTSLFHAYQEESLQDILPDYPSKEPTNFYQNNLQKYTTNGLILIILLLGIVNFSLSLYNDSTYIDEALTGVMISSHRGNSHIAPENTLPALESAIIANSDYAEIDIQQSKDGTLVLMHDNSLKRTAGVNQFIWELTDLELNELDVGSWFSLEYLNTKIPTLEEVLIYCKDRIKLNIEIKIHGNEKALEENLIALIEEYGYEYQCVVTSTNPTTLKNIKEFNETIRTGLILSSVYGDFYEREYIDFYSIRYNFVNKNIVTSAHLAGKEIYAWTVNTAREIERLKSVGVDCIITDNPSLAREVLYRDDTNDTFIQLINRMLRNRSFYRLSQILD